MGYFPATNQDAPCVRQTDFVCAFVMAHWLPNSIVQPWMVVASKKNRADDAYDQRIRVLQILQGLMNARGIPLRYVWEARKSLLIVETLVFLVFLLLD